MMLQCLCILAIIPVLCVNSKIVHAQDMMTSAFKIQSQEFGKSGCLEELCSLVEFHSLSSL